MSTYIARIIPDHCPDEPLFVGDTHDLVLCKENARRFPTEDEAYDNATAVGRDRMTMPFTIEIE